MFSKLILTNVFPKYSDARSVHILRLSSLTYNFLETYLTLIMWLILCSLSSIKLELYLWTWRCREDNDNWDNKDWTYVYFWAHLSDTSISNTSIDLISTYLW